MGAAHFAKAIGTVPTMGVDAGTLGGRRAARLNELLFGLTDAGTGRRLPKQKRQFSEAWLQQGFAFRSAPSMDATASVRQGAMVEDLGFALVQHLGGPCGALASVQAELVRELAVDRDQHQERHELLPSLLRPTEQTRLRALVRALSRILWRAAESASSADGNHKPDVIVALPSASRQQELCSTPATFVENLHLRRFTSRAELAAFLASEQCLPQLLEPLGAGVASFVCSVVLSRGLGIGASGTGVVADMNMGSPAGGMGATLLGAHSYCTQEMVNLMLIGRAFGQVFDGSRSLGGEPGSEVVLHGPSQRADVGFLSLFEAYQHIEVGQNLKLPAHPVWVICSESHYSVLFSASCKQWHKTGDGLSNDMKSPVTPFDLFFYDGLANQEELIRLTIDPMPSTMQPSAPTGEDDDDLVPPLDLVVRTRWHGAAVDWNNTEPIL